MKRFLITLSFIFLAALPLLSSYFLTAKTESKYFDAANSTYSIDCVKNLGLKSSYPITLSEGEWQSRPQPDSDLKGVSVWISDYFVADLVRESPGEEIVIEFHCYNGNGASSSSFEVQVFNGENGQRIGSILTEFIEYLYPLPSLGQIAVKSRHWQKGDQNCCPSSYMITRWKWEAQDWKEVSTEIWKKQETSKGEEMPSRSKVKPKLSI